MRSCLINSSILGPYLPQFTSADDQFVHIIDYVDLTSRASSFRLKRKSLYPKNSPHEIPRWSSYHMWFVDDIHLNEDRSPDVDSHENTTN